MATALAVVRKFFPEVEVVVDAGRNALIEVTSKDQAIAKKKSHKTCAMAVACKRKFHLDGVIMSVSTAYLIKGNKARRFKLPPSVEREVVSFDRGGGFEAGEYELTRVPASMKLDRPESMKRPGHGPQNRGAGNRKHIHRTGGIRMSLGSKQVAE